MGVDDAAELNKTSSFEGAVTAGIKELLVLMISNFDDFMRMLMEGYTVFSSYVAPSTKDR
jgi:hypothetical protein